MRHTSTPPSLARLSWPLVLALATCPASCSREPHAGDGGTTGTSEPGGSAGSPGSGGSSGPGGGGGAPSCANAQVQKCKQGTTAVGTIVHGTVFDVYEGAPVVAAFVEGGQVWQTATTSVNGGRFDLDLYIWGSCAIVGQKLTAGGAAFVDVDGDAVCDPGKDVVFVWPTVSSMDGTCGLLALTPASPRCSFSTTSGSDELAAAKAVCPAIGACLGFCGTGGQGAGGASVTCTGGGAM